MHVKTGDHVQDGRGRTFQVGQMLGRGSWGKCYLVREETDSTEWVLKVPLSDEEVPRHPPRLAEKCREIAREQGRLLEESDNDALVRIALDNGVELRRLSSPDNNLEAVFRYLTGDQ